MADGVLLYTATLTPFRGNGDQDRGLTDEYHRWLRDRGIDGVFAAGTTGEFIALDRDERTAVIASAVDVFGTEHVIAHVGAASLREALALTQAAKDVGATRFAAMTPWFEPARETSLKRYYVAIADACEGELFAYHFSARTTVVLPPEQLREIAVEAGLVGIKVSGLPAKTTLTYMLPGQPDFQVFTGQDATFADVVRGGGSGAISGISAAFPEVFVAMRDALRSGDEAGVEAQQGRIDRCIAACEGANFALLKRVAELRGAPVGPVRVALDEPTPVQLQLLQDTLAELAL